MKKITRREVLKRFTAGVSAATVFPKINSGKESEIGRDFSDSEREMFEISMEKPKIRVIYLSKPEGLEGWPYYNYNAEKRKEIFEREISKIRGAEIIGREITKSENDVDLIGNKVMDEVGIIAFVLSSPARGIRKIVEWNKPVVFINDLYGGDCSFLGRQKEFFDKGKRVISVSSSDLSEIHKKSHLLKVIGKLKNTRIICFRDRKIDPDFVKGAQDNLGIEIIQMGHKEIVDAYNDADDKDAQRLAEIWIQNAVKVVEPSREEIIKSMKMYLGMKNIMLRENASVITIDCLTMIYRKLIPAYPCLTFSMLNDMGHAGVCEADLRATITQIIVGYIAERPGYVSDPVLDTSNNTITHCHCVAATRMNGTKGRPEPYIIRSHSEDRKGASLQVKMKVGQKITAAKYVPFNKMLVSTGEIVGNEDIDRACRTKVITKVENPKKMMNNYYGGLHRIIFYGDWSKYITDMGNLLGYSVVEEM